MKKKILNFILVVCLILPCMFMIVGCKKEESKYSEIVGKINSSQTFAKEYFSLLVDNTLATNFKCEINYEDTNLIYSFNAVDKSICTQRVFDQMQITSLEIFADGLYYSIDSSDIYVYELEEGEEYSDNVESMIALDVLKEGNNFKAKAYKNYYEVSVGIYDDENDENVKTYIRVVDGVIRHIKFGSLFEFDLETLQDSDVIDINNSAFDSVESLSFSEEVTIATSVPVSFFEKVNQVSMHDGVILSDDADLYMSNNFLTVEEGYYERSMPV